MSELKGKAAVITGASSPGGIGQAIARRLARAGASIYLMAEGGEDGLAAGVAACRALSPGDAQFEFGVHDLSKPGVPEAMIADAAKRFGRIDILVNNAGVRARLPFEEIRRDLFDEALAVNIAAPYFASQAAVPLMRRQGGGRIIHIASQMGTVTHENRSVYGLTKAALIHLAKSMAYELSKDGILVNAISPGPVETTYLQQEYAKSPGLGKARNAYMRLDRLGRPEEIAEVAFFLASTAPELLLGQNLIVDGGYTIH
jgi:NAD(P)-dependent dehydrogenase (short-subunit alcohol dehydrogenase family)